MNVRDNLGRDERIRKELGLSPEEISNYKINRGVCRGIPEDMARDRQKTRSGVKEHFKKKRNLNVAENK